MKVHAPGKLILSGEHAVLYGHPALALAVNRYATAYVTPGTRSHVLFDLKDIAYRKHFTRDRLYDVKERIKRKYKRFLQGDFSIREVLHKPFELAQYAFSLLSDSFNFSLPQGVKIEMYSNIPIGCGMGSSAATILSVMKAVCDYLQIPLTDDMLFQIALEAENAQHGHSSGLDLRVALQGGCFYWHNQLLERRPLPKAPLLLVNTGSPITTTGECVQKVATHFATSALGDDFATITNKMDQALKNEDGKAFADSIRANHRLLSHIGVVPNKIQDFIKEIEMLQGAAKICGAGAVNGERAGVVLVYQAEQSPQFNIAISTLCAKFGFAEMAVQGEWRGVHREENIIMSEEDTLKGEQHVY